MPDLDLAILAGRAYADPPTWVGKRLGTEDVHALRVDVLCGTVIAFRGTTLNPLDWIRDLDAMAMCHPKIGWCHAGFLRGAQAVSGQIIAEMADPNRVLLPVAKAVPYTARRIILVGHSLGGILAIVVGAIMCAAGCPPDEIVTFGAPRGVFPKARRILRGKVRRIVQYRNGNDPVPGILWPFPLPYRHIETLQKIGTAHFIDIECHHLLGYVQALRNRISA